MALEISAHESTKLDASWRIFAGCRDLHFIVLSAVRLRPKDWQPRLSVSPQLHLCQRDRERIGCSLCWCLINALTGQVDFSGGAEIAERCPQTYRPEELLRKCAGSSLRRLGEV